MSHILYVLHIYRSTIHIIKDCTHRLSKVLYYIYIHIHTGICSRLVLLARTAPPIWLINESSLYSRLTLFNLLLAPLHYYYRRRRCTAPKYHANRITLNRYRLKQRSTIDVRCCNVRYYCYCWYFLIEILALTIKPFKSQVLN